MYKYLLAALLLTLSFNAHAQKKFKTTKTGLKYIMFTAQKGEKAKVGNMVKFHFILRDNKDSVLLSSYKSMIAPNTIVQKSIYPGDLFEAFTMLAEGDSALFQISADSFYKGQPKMPVASGTMLTIMIKLLEIYSPEKEQQQLAKYLKDSVKNYQKTSSGMYYVIEKDGTGPVPQSGQTIVAHYTGKFLDGKVFDSDKGATFSFVLGQHQVIRGWDDGFALLKKGTKARFIIPSSLAYGPQGAGGVIPPYAPLIFDVELVDIK